MHITANGIRINYRIDGTEGAPWLTLVTGIANDLTMWDHQLPEVERDFRVLRFDLRGHGGTEATAPPYSLDLLIGDILALWHALGVEHSSLIGLGLGGAITIGLAGEHSERLIKLVPSCCRATMTPDFAAIWPGFVETVRQHGMEGMVEPTVRRWFTEDFRVAHPEIIDNVRQMIRRTDPRGYEGCIAAFLTLGFSDRLARIAVPTLFVSGADDHLGGPPEIMEGLAAAVPGARHVSVPKAAHIANIQNADGFNAVIGAFLRE